MTFSTQTLDFPWLFLVFLVRTSYTAADTLTAVRSDALVLGVAEVLGDPCRDPKYFGGPLEILGDPHTFGTGPGCSREVGDPERVPIFFG